MDGQDWKPVVLRKKKEEQVHAFKEKVAILSDDPAPPKIVGQKMGKLIQQARMGKKLTQKDLANKLNLDVGVIRDYENGSSVLDKGVLNKIRQFLGIKKV